MLVLVCYIVTHARIIRILIAIGARAVALKITERLYGMIIQQCWHTFAMFPDLIMTAVVKTTIAIAIEANAALATSFYTIGIM